MDLLERLTRHYSDASGRVRELADRAIDSGIVPAKTQGIIEVAAMPLIDANDRVATGLRSRFKDTAEI